MNEFLWGIFLIIIPAMLLWVYDRRHNPTIPGKGKGNYERHRHVIREVDEWVRYVDGQKDAHETKERVTYADETPQDRQRSVHERVASRMGGNNGQA